MRLDRLDEQIVALLVDDARRSYADLGAQVGLTASAVKRRVDRLREGGAITGFTVRLDPGALGWTVEGYVELYCRSSTPPEVIRAAVARFAEVVDASTISGDADAMLRILAADMRHFERVLEQIGAEPFVARTKSVLVLSPLLRRAAGPLPS
ncbi:Lrp/AsnC ligand binding domain-containing protein [Pseudonocardia acidicola]|uniref:Lrp/AsnC family transcriptional regulator n=1 Tax=Pseudonocardia acidicola TaxID=2724939 RepID=A0ABX1SKA5_9PSEU|nr:Lrp/AsnC family transcriptional regulator [Pseudonocardia acidicola]